MKRRVVAKVDCPCGDECFKEGTAGKLTVNEMDNEFIVDTDFDTFFYDEAEFRVYWAVIKNERDKEYEDLFI